MSSFRFRKKTEYGLMMVGILAEAGDEKVVSVAKMQERGLPRSFLVKIARDLIKAGIVSAKEGRGGGYMLVGEPSKISILRVVEALEGNVATVACLVHGARKCPLADHCPHLNLMKDLTTKMSAVLEQYSLKDLR